MAWLDGEAGRRTAEVAAHLERCRECAAEVEAWQKAGHELRALVEAGAGEPEPLLALQTIRDRIAAGESRGLVARLAAWWDEVWLLNRRAVAGVVAAAALGALSAPGVVYLVGRLQGPAYTPMVVVEDLEVGGNATAVVWGGGEDSTTLIWVQPKAGDSHEETF